VKHRAAQGPTRRGIFRTGAGLALAAGSGLAAVPSAAKTDPTTPSPGSADAATEPFFGRVQGGIVTPPQRHTYFAALDLTTDKGDAVVALLREWTVAAAAMAAGHPAKPLGDDLAAPGGDTGESLGLPPARLTLTFGFGRGLFLKGDKDRYGLAARRPAALIDMPRFAGDQLVETRSDGDLSLQACAEEPQVAFHAVRQLARLAYGRARMRWAQTGFIPDFRAGETPRNLMGFRDGTNNPAADDPELMGKFVWVGEEGPAWMRDGSYLVARRIRIALEHWDRMKIAFQEETVGRHKYSGAPIGGKHEHEPLDLAAVDDDGNPVIAENAHVRLAAAESNDGARILRRAYSYNDGVNFTAERWPPWRQGMEYDAGLFFLCYQRDPRTGFVKIFERMARFDMLNQFVTHTGGALFACPGGVGEGEFIGQRLFEQS
jgi:deferrochelatase/peroxidase EfeB